MALPAKFTEDPNWWACHLHEAAACGTDDNGDCVSYLNAVFGTTLESINRFWKDTMEMDQENGYWPQLHIGLPHGHVVSVIYFGTPRYDVEYRYNSPEGESILLAVQGPNGMLPGLRWTEVKAISSLVPHIKPLTLLALTPAACVSIQEAPRANREIKQALSKLGYSSAAATELAAILAKGLQYEMKWAFENSYGWVTEEKNCWRCPMRDQYGLTSMAYGNFIALKRFTEAIGLNPKFES